MEIMGGVSSVATVLRERGGESERGEGIGEIIGETRNASI